MEAKLSFIDTLREQLGKGHGPLSMAWWAKGVHELALGRTDDARTSFERSLERAVEAARDVRTTGERRQHGSGVGVLLGDPRPGPR